jgi:hypothetical protein
MALAEAAQSAASARLAPGCLTVNKPRNASQRPARGPRSSIDDRSRVLFLPANPAGSQACEPSLAAEVLLSLDPTRPLTGWPFVKPDAASTSCRPEPRPAGPLRTAGHLTMALTAGLDPEAP